VTFPVELKKRVNGSLLCYVAAPEGVSIELIHEAERCSKTGPSTTVFQITPPRAFRYDTLVIAVGSVTNDFGTPGASQYAVPLETPVQAMRFNRHLVNADESPTVIDGIRPRKSGSQTTAASRSTAGAFVVGSRLGAEKAESYAPRSAPAPRPALRR
jgi:hypothetical protein